MCLSYSELHANVEHRQFKPFSDLAETTLKPSPRRDNAAL